jgi:hypothetical protein
MDSHTAVPLATKPSRHVLAAGTIWFVVYFGARLALEDARLPDPLRLAAAFAPLLAFFAFVWVVQRAITGADELQRLIQLQALALAFPTTLVVLMTLGLMEMFHGGQLRLPPLRDLWAMLPLLYAICAGVAYWRYR